MNRHYRPAKSRGAGVGDALIAEVVEWAESRKASRVELDLNDSNLPARRLYEHNQFALEGNRGAVDEVRRVRSLLAAQDPRDATDAHYVRFEEAAGIPVSGNVHTTPGGIDERCEASILERVDQRRKWLRYRAPCRVFGRAISSGSSDPSDNRIAPLGDPVQSNVSIERSPASFLDARGTSAAVDSVRRHDGGWLRMVIEDASRENSAHVSCGVGGELVAVGVIGGEDDGEVHPGERAEEHRHSQEWFGDLQASTAGLDFE